MSGVRGKDAALLAACTGFGGFVLAVVTGLLPSLGSTAGPAIAVRGVLVTLLLVLSVRLCLGGRPASSLVPTAAAGLTAGYLLDLAWLDGAAFVARAVTQQVAVCIVLDLALWLGVGLAALRLVPAGRDEVQGYL